MSWNAAASGLNVDVLGESVVSFSLAPSCSEDRASVMSSGKVDTIRCHPLWGFFLPECSRQHWREKKKAEALVLRVPAQVSEIDQRSAPCRCIPSWLIGLSSVGDSHPPCVYTPVAPCQQLSASIRPQKQHHDAHFMAVITCSCTKQVRRTPSPRCARLSQTHTRSFSWLPGLFRGTKEVFKKSKWGHSVRMNWLIPVS